MPSIPTHHSPIHSSFGKPKSSLGEVPGGSLDAVKTAIDNEWGKITQGNTAILAKSEAAWLDLVIQNAPEADRPAIAKHIREKLQAGNVQVKSADVKTWVQGLGTPIAPAPTPDLPPTNEPTAPPVQPGTIGDGTTVTDAQTVPDFNRAPPASNHIISLEQVQQRFGSHIAGVADLFSSVTKLPNGTEIKAPTHMMGQKPEDIRLIAYNDANGPNQKDVARFVAPDEIAIAIKHHSVKPNSDDKEMMKLQCTHIEIVVGVQTEDGPGAITINNPQTYQQGLFGDENYPMIFVKPEFPPGLSNAEKKAYVDNIRTWLVIANTFTDFPGDYNGGDPLATRSPAQIRKLGDMVLQALIGTPEEQQAAEAWLADPKNQVYCAELAHVALNLGIHYPLNKEHLGERFEAVKNAIKSKAFLSKNSNDNAGLVSLKMAPESLEPIAQKLPDIVESDPAPGKPFGSGLAIQPFTVADIVERFITETVPRDQMGEGLAPVQAAMLEKAKPGLLEAIGMDQLPENDPKRVGVELLYAQLVGTVGQSYGSYAEFRAALKPFLIKAQSIVGPRDDGTGAFVPPHCYLVRATDDLEGKPHQGVFSWQYLGHGLHESLLKPAEG